MRLRLLYSVFYSLLFSSSVFGSEWAFDGHVVGQEVSTYDSEIQYRFIIKPINILSGEWHKPYIEAYLRVDQDKSLPNRVGEYGLFHVRYIADKERHHLTRLTFTPEHQKDESWLSDAMSFAFEDNLETVLKQQRKKHNLLDSGMATFSIWKSQGELHSALHHFTFPVYDMPIFETYLVDVLARFEPAWHPHRHYRFSIYPRANNLVIRQIASLPSPKPLPRL